MRVDSPSSSSSFSVRLAAALLVITIASTAAAVAASDTPSINHHETTPYSLVHNNTPSLQLPPHIQQHLHHHQHQQHLKHYSSSSIAKRATSQATPPQAWIDYYSSTGAFVSEATFSSGTCLSLSSSWGILDITPFTRPNPTNGERDQLVFYNDRNCVSINREPASKTGYVVIAMYFNKVPQSLQWTRVTSGSATTTTTTAKTMTSSAAVPITTVTAPQPPSTLTSSIPIPLASPPPQPPSPDTAGDGSAPSPPRHSQFPNALIPPKPLPDSSSSSAWGDNCGGPENDPDSPGCKGARQVTHFLIVGITIAVVAVGFMAAGSFYIYRRFYAPEPLPTTTGTGGSSSYRSNQLAHNNNNNNSNSLSHNTNSNSYAFSGTHNMNSSSSNSHTASGTGTVSGSVPGMRLGDDANPDYQYCHDEDDEPDDGSKPPKFMFDHRHDNINTNRNPRFFKESSSHQNTLSAAAVPYPNSSSDIALIERVRK